MPDATPSPTQIIIQKVGAVIIPNPNFFLKLITYLTSVRKVGKKQLSSLNCQFEKVKNQKLDAMRFGVSSGSGSGSN
jgi:hypothetical protein